MIGRNISKYVGRVAETVIAANFASPGDYVP